MTDEPWVKCASTVCERSGRCRFPSDCLVGHGFTAGDADRLKGAQSESDDAAWREDAERNGWALEHLRAAWPWRLPGVRHVRFVWHLWRAEHQARLLSGAGIGLPMIQPYDRWVLHAIWRGWA